MLSTFPAIDTVVDNIKFSQGLEHLAKVIDRGTLIRSYQAGDLGFILHSRHQYQWHTGYAPPQTVAAPHLGAIVSRTLGPLEPAVPAFINIGQRFDVGEGEELKAFTTAGFLGSEYGPFSIPFPDQAADSVRPPGGMTPGRFEDRHTFYQKLLEASPIGQHGSAYQKESLLRAYDNAHRLLSSPAAQAFDLSLEPIEHVRKYVPGYEHGQTFNASRDRFGAKYEQQMVGRFGLGCLLARRLVEVGARYIEVTTEYIPFLNWDTHENGHTRIAEMKKQIDAPIAQLVLDLEERGLLDRTLIVLASEFSRDLLIEGKPDRKVKDQVDVPDTITELKHYGMHRHFTDAGMRAALRRRHEARPPARRDRRRAPVPDDEGSGHHRRPARHDLPGARHLAAARLRNREAPVLRDARRPRQTDRQPLRVTCAGRGAAGCQFLSCIAGT